MFHFLWSDDCGAAGPPIEEVELATFQAQLDALKQNKQLLERIRKLQAKADEIGLPGPAFDMKKFTDDMWADT